jgi:multidrug efflux system membrane fusion protein
MLESHTPVQRRIGDLLLARFARLGRGLAALLVCAQAVTAAGCSGDKAEPKAPPPRPPVPVAVAPVERKTMPLQIQAIGSVEAYAVVSVRAQVGGELMRAHIKEGQEVKKGDLLFTIDPRVYEAAVAQAEANLAKDRGQVQQARAAVERDQSRVSQARANMLKDQAQAKNAEVQERRYYDLLQRGLIAQEQYDGLRTASESLAATVHADEADVKSAEETVRADEAAVRSAEQTVRADEATVDNAKLQLGYTTIRSPIDGRAGSLMLNEGNIVRSGGTTDSTLIVINQVRPIYVSFTVPQQQLPAVRRYMAEGKLVVDASPAGEPRPVKGVVTFVDNTVDATTGTIRLKATFANDENRLWPGQFVNVALTLATQADALVIPSQAVQAGQQGQAYVFVVKADSTVDNRPVGVARTQGSESIIAKGLEAGENVVIDGQARLVAGAKVEVRGRGPRTGGSADAPSTPKLAPDGAAAAGKQKSPDAGAAGKQKSPDAGAAAEKAKSSLPPRGPQGGDKAAPSPAGPGVPAGPRDKSS